MGEYEFTLKFELPDQNIDPEIYVDQLYESGCDDALIGIGKKGYIALDFIRESNNAYDALSSAIENVLKVIPQANIVEAKPDFVGITDLAKLLGCTRQNIQKLMSKDNSKCPHAVYGGSQSIWHLADLLTWLVEEQDYQIEESLIEMAKTTLKLNLAKQTLSLAPDWPEKFQTLVGSK
ncbi:DNA-binding protein [Crocosphaera sp. UHCC 0190]|uniref:helix-turn-helix transcriptional regulator n=1 Tax=Crocosphaera sp. UHCC 0190 TaxID=3110246 RepID=UPI002B21798A|nr:DNA-binding protein [Crocosphaera sp. UHCC 0190]MEA5512413.1 DNA-binding protein [Crocosphaera sp. UHCC 0190]